MSNSSNNRDHLFHAVIDPKVDDLHAVGGEFALREFALACAERTIGEYRRGCSAYSVADVRAAVTARDSAAIKRLARTVNGMRRASTGMGGMKHAPLSALPELMLYELVDSPPLRKARCVAYYCRWLEGLCGEYVERKRQATAGTDPVDERLVDQAGLARAQREEAAELADLDRLLAEWTAAASAAAAPTVPAAPTAPLAATVVPNVACTREAFRAALEQPLLRLQATCGEMGLRDFALFCLDQAQEEGGVITHVADAVRRAVTLNQPNRFASLWDAVPKERYETALKEVGKNPVPVTAELACYAAAMLDPLAAAQDSASWARTHAAALVHRQRESQFSHHFKVVSEQTVNEWELVVLSHEDRYSLESDHLAALAAYRAFSLQFVEVERLAAKPRGDEGT